jgi:5,10-methylenetetrahydromethanopterin reductase
VEFGVTFPPSATVWCDAQVAEANGFTHAWFYDSQLLYSDVYACMALVAAHTRTLKLGTLVAVPSNRIAPVTATAVATINAIAPGRVILGIGTGGTGRSTMGLPAMPVREFACYVRQLRGLLAGEDVLFREGDSERWIRLIHADRRLGFLNLDDPIEIHIAANGPRALQVAGELGDGWITPLRSPDTLEAGFRSIAAARSGQARPYATILTAACILRAGETLASSRVIQCVGPNVVVRAHMAWEAARGGGGLGVKDDSLALRYGDYIDQYAEAKRSPPDRRYLDAHEGHLLYLKPGEEAFVTERAISSALVGTPDQILERIRGLESAGVRNLAVQLVGTERRELIEEFGREVISRM